MNSDVDLEARRRAASIYLPTGAHTMLPPDLIKRIGVGMGPTSETLSVGFRCVLPTCVFTVHLLQLCGDCCKCVETLYIQVCRET